MSPRAHPALRPAGLRRAPSWLEGAVVLSLCLAGVAPLVPPALARGSEIAPSVPVSVRLEGELSTSGLPGTPAVSRLSVRNEGAAAVSWSARSSVVGAGAAAIRVETWVSADLRCTVPTRLLTASDWSAAALPPGGSAGLCVRVTATGKSSGILTPSVTVAARPAGI